MNRETRLRALRWSAPVVAVAAIAVAASGVLNADANPPLPARTAAQLLVDLETSQVNGLSGTIVQNAKLGLPQLPSTGPGSDSSLFSLLAGSHTMRVWAAGPTKHRVALLGNLGESDVIHNGSDVWMWDSSTKTATHYRLPAGTESKKPDISAPADLTPQEAADAALKAIDPTTAISTDGTASVAGRSAYELVLTPKDARSLVGQVRIALDAEAHIPLRVRVYAKGSNGSPAYEVGFTRISLTTPGEEEFRFTPPPNTTVRESNGTPADKTGMPKAADGDAKIIGKGWASVVAIPNVKLPSGDATKGADGGQGELVGVLDRMPKVSGGWGSGRLLSGSLFSALLTDDGRLYVGLVSPDALYAAAGHR
jgi:outer membrane lipoprotein-sorting protein